MDYTAMYNTLKEIQSQLQNEFLSDAASELLPSSELRTAKVPRKIQALAATYTLQDYLANLIASESADDSLDSPVVETILGEAVAKLAQIEGDKLNALNEQLQADPAFAVSGHTVQRSMETIRKLTEKN